MRIEGFDGLYLYCCGKLRERDNLSVFVLGKRVISVISRLLDDICFIKLF